MYLVEKDRKAGRGLMVHFSFFKNWDLLERDWINIFKCHYFNAFLEQNYFILHVTHLLE
jgi:hypothetical protein